MSPETNILAWHSSHSFDPEPGINLDYSILLGCPEADVRKEYGAPIVNPIEKGPIEVFVFGGVRDAFEPGSGNSARSVRPCLVASFKANFEMQRRNISNY